jgi:outer membrane protein insertion porin family
MKSTSSAETWPILRPSRLKRLVFTIAAATLIVGTLVFAVWVYIRSESFNNYIAGEIKSKLREFGLRAEIGNFGISWDTQTARLRDLKIYNERTGQLVATVESLDTLIEINAPLKLGSSREIVIKTVDVGGADFYYEISPQGRTNLDGVRYVAPKSEAITLDTTRLIAAFDRSAIHLKDLSRRIEVDVREARVTAQPQPNNPTVVNLRFNSAAGRVSYAGRESKLGKLDLTARVSKDRAEVEGLSLESNVAQVKAKGRIEDWAAPRYGFDIDSRVKLDEASRVLALNRSLNGGATIKGRIDGEGANYNFKGDASGNEVSIANIKLSEARIPFSGAGNGDRIAFASDQIRARDAVAKLTNDDAVRLASIVINGLKGEMVSGETTIIAPRVGVAAIEWPQSKLENLSLDNVAAKVSGANYEVKASATLARGEVRGAQIAGAEAVATLDNSALTLSDIKAALFGGTVAGECVLPFGPGAAQRVKASFADVETRSATAIFDAISDKGELPISGKVSGEAELSFFSADPRSLNGRIAAHFDGKSDEASEAIPITGDVEVKAVNGVFNFDQLKLAASGSTLIGAGSLSVDGDSDLRVSLNSTSAERLLQIARGFEAARSYIERYEPQIIGDFKFEGRVTGPIEKATIEADVEAGIFGLRDAILGSFAGHIFISQSEARIEKGVITTSNGESIKFDFAAPLDQNGNTGRLDATIDRMNLEMILAASGSPSANQFITGAVSGEVHLTGLPAKPLGSATLNLVNGRVADREAQLATARLKFEGKNATLEMLEVQMPPQRLTASGSMNLDDYSFKVGGKAERISLASLPEAFELKETSVEGMADADFQIGGKVLTGKQIDLDWENLKLELTAQGRGVKVNGRDAGELKLTAQTSAGGRLDAQLFTGILATNGKSHNGRKPDLIKASVELRAPGRPIRIESNLANVDIAPFVDAFAPELNPILKGAVTGSLRIEGPSLDENGSPTFDRLRGALTLMDVALLVADNPVKVETPTMVTLEGSQIKIPQLRVTGEGADLKFGGTLAVSDQAAMDFSLAGSVNLDRLPSLHEGLILFGSGEVDARLTGTFDVPRVFGKVEFNGFGFSAGESPFFVSNGNGRFRLAGDHIILETFTADANDGRIEAGGLINLDRLRPKEWRYDIKAENAVLAYQEITATVNGDLTLAGTPEGQTLVGQITIPQAEYKPSFDIDNLALGNGGGLSLGTLGSFSGPSTSTTQLKIPAINLDVRVEARDSLIVQNDQINTVGSGILTLTGPITNPDKVGPITLDGGTWRFRGQRYEIIAGSLEFLPGGATPLLNLQAEGDYNGYRVTIGLSGPISNPELTLRSDPQLTRNEILALITTGRTEAGTLGVRDPSVGAAASLLSSGLISRPTEQLLGLSRFQIDPMIVGPSANPAARLTVGQQFARNLYLSYSTNLGVTAQQTVLGEYTLSNRFSALAAYTQGGSATQQGQSEEGAFTIELRGRQRFSLGFNPERISTPGAGADAMTRVVRPKLPQAQVKVNEIQNFKLGQNKMRELLPVMTQGFSRSLMRLGERRLKEHLQENGFFFAEVKARCEPENCAVENLRVFYDVEPGAIYDLKEIRIEGTDLIKLKDIAEELQSQPASAAGSAPFLKSLPLVGGYARGLTSGDRLNSDEEIIRRKLVDVGYRNARVKSRLAFKPDNDDLIVVFDVDPGVQSEIADVNLRGNTVAQTSELMAVVPVQPNNAFSYSQAQLGAQRIKQLYAERGFLDTIVAPEFIELDGERLRLVYNINEGSRAVVSEIEINGTTKTGDGWVRRFLAFKQGDVLTPEKIRQTQRDLYATNAFREVNIRTEPIAGGDGTAHKVSINLTEAKPLLFGYGLGYSTDVNSPRGSLEITNTNLFGSLDSLSLRGRASQKEQFGQLSFTDLRPFSWRLPTTFAVFYNRNDNLRPFSRRRLVNGQEEIANTFGVERFAAFIQTERKLDDRTSMRFRYNQERARLISPTCKDNAADIPETVVTRNECKITLGMFSAGFSRDTRDSAIDPTRGQLFSADHSVAARIFGGTESFNKFVATYQQYKTLDQFTPLLGDSTLAFSARIGLASTFNASDRDDNGLIDDNDRLLPISERFFSGGATTLRGFRFEAAGPQAVVEPRPDSQDRCDNPLRTQDTPCVLPTLFPLGGDALTVFNFELRYPLTSRLRFVPFYDLGNVFKRVSDFRFSRMTNTVGVGMRINTPLGPLGVDYGFLIDPPAFTTSSGALLRQPRGGIHIRFGQTF